MKESRTLFVCALVLFVGATVALADWEPADGHKMHYPQTPDPCGWDVAFYNLAYNYLLGDDWQCSETGPVEDIHFWVSFSEDYADPCGMSFAILIFGNVPAGQDPCMPWSHPGPELWFREFVPGDYSYRYVPTGWQGWLDPFDPFSADPCDHLGCYQINITDIPDPCQFIQEEGEVYWLVIGNVFSGWETLIGWKQSEVHFEDDGVYWDPLFSPFGGWMPLTDPFTGETIDLAFVITGGEEPEYDFGDAPDPCYPTLLANDGARHIVDGSTYLGADVDFEADGQPHPQALGDDNDGNDDEDGVAFTSLIIPGDPCATVDVVASVAGKLNAWLDFNDDGDWADPCEQIFTDTNLTAGTNNLLFAVPGSAAVDLTFARFRFDTNGGLSYTGQAPNGEVEDYMVEIDSQQVCEALWDQTGCKPANCPQQGNECQPALVNFDPVTSETSTVDCNCLGTDDCHIYIPPPLDNPCTVSDNGSGTATLPPIGCQYECIPNQEQWMIVEGLPPDTTIELGGILYDFICYQNPTQNCSMPLAQQECETSGGSLGGEGHCFEATLQFNVIGTGSLVGFSRTLAVPIEGELHTAPRNPGDPVQMFSVNIVRLSGELFGDPDFCTLRVTAGTDSDLPSWGRTILTDLGNGNFAVDSFFDITYEVEFQGCPGSQLDGYSGTTTGTVRMQTGDMPSCIGDCEPGMVCEDIITLNPDGSIDISCECEEEVCEPAWDGLYCEPISCPQQGDQCKPAAVNFHPVTGDTIVTDCDCRGLDECHVAFSRDDEWPCSEPNNGFGTIDMPPDCDYTGTEPFMIKNDLPVGTTIEMDGILMDFINIVTAPGGKLGGEVEYFDSTLDLTVRGTGSLAGFNRHLAVPIECEVHTAPRQPWEPVQVFIMDMNSLTGELFGDPDFCTFRVKAGTGNGLPSPGQTTLIELPSGDFAVDSFFDITYQIEFEGCPASQLDSYAGTTTATVRIETGILPHPTCAGDCPLGWACKETTIDNPDETIDIFCECVELQCEPTPDGSSCQPADCPEQGDQCQPACVNFDPVTGDTTVNECDCRGLDDCHVEFLPQYDWPCAEPNNGSGTIDLPPDCDYTGTKPFIITSGLPYGTTILMDGILMDWYNLTRRDGGKLGGQVQMFEATLDLDVRGTGSLNGFNRHLAVPIECELHSAPPDAWEPVQVFIMDMNSLTGELFGDPDFCTFRVRAGTGNGLPGPGQTTLLKLPTGDFAVDSFFDITYEIEFEGCPGGTLESYSGTTTATTRIETGTLPNPACAGDCPAGMVCKKIITANPDGTIDICCERVPGETPQCIVPDNGTGTIDLPPEDCEYTGPDPADIWIITEGLPSGTTIEMEGILMDWVSVVRSSGGTLSGEIQEFDATLDLDVSGTGSLADFNRHLAVPMVCEVHTAPRTPGDPVQTFATDMYDMTGELFGDPDFCEFIVTAGTYNSLPSPGETTLVRLPSGDFAVDSFFDITYEIEFEGCPASQLDGYSGTTTATVHMSTCRQYSFDFDYNGIIDFYDFLVFAQRWLREDIACCIADHDTDGDVDLDDLAYHGSVWLAGAP